MRFSTMVVLWMWLLLAIPAPPLGVAQPVPSDTVTSASGTVRAASRDTLPAGHPNRVPYRSDRSLLGHVLAAPAYVLHYSTRPLGWAVRKAEERLPQVFEGRLPSYGAYPIFETGGPSGFAGGAVLFYNDLPWGGHNAEVRALIGSRAYNRFEGTYEVTDVFDGSTRLGLRGQYFSDPRERFFTGGNDAEGEDETFYATRQTEFRLEADTDWSSRVETEISTRFQRVSVDPGGAAIDDEEERLIEDLPGVGTTNLASAEAAVALDLASQSERSVEGTRLGFGAEYAQEVGAGRDAVRFARYRAEIVQFVPLPLFPPQRRLALRGLLEKAEPLGDGKVPFYRLPSLGGTRHLRGYGSNRFRDEGILLLTAEYRWPVWHNLDAVLFTEAGQVFSQYEDLAPDAFHLGYGGGFHFVTGSQLAFRLELAGSSEGVRTILTVRPAL